MDKLEKTAEMLTDAIDRLEKLRLFCVRHSNATASLINANDLLHNVSKSCNWTKAFDGHYNISCVGETGERGNQNFNIKWKFKHCPYCGGKLNFC